MIGNCQCISPNDCFSYGCQADKPVAEQSLIYRLRKRAEIRRQIPDRVSVKENKPDRIADLLEEAANKIEEMM